MPEHLVREALAATRDAVERRRSGQGGCRSGPWAYFAGVAMELTAEADIDLELKPGGREDRGSESPERPKEARDGQREDSGGRRGLR